MGQKLRSVLQPIVDGETGQVVAHEALLRGPRGTPWESPDVLFQSAIRLGHQTMLEANARRLAVSRLEHLPSHQRLFINVDCLSPDLPLAPGQAHIPPARIVLEISERQSIIDNPSLLAQAARWRAAGFAIALDDYGAGFMGPGALLKLRPDILKLDRVIVSGISGDPMHHTVVCNIVNMAQSLNIGVVAEGVETPEEFWRLRDCGVRLMQGYLLGRPQDEPISDAVAIPGRPASWEALELMVDLRARVGQAQRPLAGQRWEHA